MNESIKREMKNFYWLVRREFWENKTIFWWLPLTVGALLSILFLVVEIQFKELLNPDARKLQQQIFGATKWVVTERELVKSVVSDLSRFFLHLLLFTSAFMSIFYLLGALFEERKNRSVLFWKSLPVSDTSEVLVKLIFPLLLSPLIALIVGFSSYFLPAFFVAVATLFYTDTLFASIILNPDLYMMPLQLLSMLPLYALWALPTAAWFLMVSSWARSRTFPWAFGVPLLVEIIMLFTNLHLTLGWNVLWITTNIFARIVGGLFPGMWTMPDTLSSLATFEYNMFLIDSAYTQGWLMLTSPKLWLGIVAGIAMIIISVRQRRYADVI